MIHIFVGTKAQFIKMLPVMKELESQGIKYNLIDSGQHGSLTRNLANEFDLPKATQILSRNRKDINLVKDALIWTASVVFQLVFKRVYIYKNIFKGQKGVCLIHGDTITTLFSMLYAKRLGLKVAMVEAGLRSFDIFNPFPEELIRLVVMKYSDILFAPSKRASSNLKHMGYGEKSINVGCNTIFDTLKFVKNLSKKYKESTKPYVVATLHRVEALYSKYRLEFFINVLEKIAKEYRVVFVLHEPTKNQLVRRGLLRRLKGNESICLLPLQGYIKFIQLLSNAEYVVTDGGSIQEECYFLNVPCLVMRSKTERTEHLKENIYLAEFNQRKVDYFVKNYKRFKRVTRDRQLNPSKEVVKHVLKYRFSKDNSE
jgi:UDP-N-acetylglucosamine 2-epimerase